MPDGAAAGIGVAGTGAPDEGDRPAATAVAAGVLTGGVVVRGLAVTRAVADGDPAGDDPLVGGPGDTDRVDGDGVDVAVDRPACGPAAETGLWPLTVATAAAVAITITAVTASTGRREVFARNGKRRPNM